MFRHFFSIAFITVLLAACSQPSKLVESQTIPRSATGPDSGVVPSDWSQHVALPRQTIEEGSCGLFLWANTQEKTLIFYASNKEVQGHVMLNGQQTKLPRLGAYGNNLFGLFSEQSYKSDALEVSISYRAEIKEGLNEGALIKDASMRVIDAAGWEMVLPVAGLIGCN